MNHGNWDRIRVVQYGCGKMGRIIMRYLLEKGAEIVGAIDTDEHLVDKDIAEVAGLKQPTGIKIRNSNDTVLDNCMGSGTTAIAAMREGRHYIGFELNREYYDKAVQRIKDEQPTLFT